ncbi:MAG: hypothetical protein H7X75_01355 [Burkholderiaceae bacterium]|nr:hypothetical protein [Burkholderiaceae bacterium]
MSSSRVHWGFVVCSHMAGNLAFDRPHPRATQQGALDDRFNPSNLSNYARGAVSRADADHARGAVSRANAGLARGAGSRADAGLAHDALR